MLTELITQTVLNLAVFVFLGRIVWQAARRAENRFPPTQARGRLRIEKGIR